MKKIVALVLSLVMVLGLATTAFGANTDLGTKYLMNTTNDTNKYAVEVEFVPAVAPTVDPDTGLTTAGGSVAYYSVVAFAGTANEATYKYVEVASLALADAVLYNDVDGKVVFKYVKTINNVNYEGVAVAFTNFGKACGQYKAAVSATAKYYVFNGTNVYVAKDGTGTQLMVDGKLVEVETYAGSWNQHVASYTYNDKFEVTAVKCGVCGLDAVIVPNYASLPEAAVAGAANNMINNGQYFYFPVAAAPAVDADKVESAETFDAGIAMYVGMSVMAAAGSAVVLKKKD